MGVSAQGIFKHGKAVAARYTGCIANAELVGSIFNAESLSLVRPASDKLLSSMGVRLAQIAPDEGWSARVFRMENARCLKNAGAPCIGRIVDHLRQDLLVCPTTVPFGDDAGDFGDERGTHAKVRVCIEHLRRQIASRPRLGERLFLCCKA